MVNLMERRAGIRPSLLIRYFVNPEINCTSRTFYTENAVGDSFSVTIRLGISTVLVKYFSL